MLIETDDGALVDLSHVWIILWGERNERWYVEAVLDYNYPSDDSRKVRLITNCTE